MVQNSVVDPDLDPKDPYVFGSSWGSVNILYGSGSFHQHTKKVRKKIELF
jgi:hypothetical protein